MRCRGRFRHGEYSFEIEYPGRHGDTVVVMGCDRIVDPPDGLVSDRRYTNIWQLQDGIRRFVARTSAT